MRFPSLLRLTQTDRLTAAGDLTCAPKAIVRTGQPATHEVSVDRNEVDHVWFQVGCPSLYRFVLIAGTV